MLATSSLESGELLRMVNRTAIRATYRLVHCSAIRISHRAVSKVERLSPESSSAENPLMLINGATLRQWQIPQRRQHRRQGMDGTPKQNRTRTNNQKPCQLSGKRNLLRAPPALSRFRQRRFYPTTYENDPMSLLQMRAGFISATN
jgi:hypothetical protein